MDQRQDSSLMSSKCRAWSRSADTERDTELMGSCPPGHMVRVNGTRKSCVYTLCATRPCHRGTCVAQSPSKFTCHCTQGYRGRHCETTLAIYREDVGLSFSSLFAICICFMALLAQEPSPPHDVARTDGSVFRSLEEPLLRNRLGGKSYTENELPV
ncbi:hypothetical protein EYF80_031401 [Liparis tanakae]|uniref:EGF-like domain-containing protein n=1 Tax=Liparis tanakae TaxID=230148 RepID=A0A4Z2GYQ7_9TELE|nr:hypothetical protein EYF80_031401 [Liparis tanakae]